jgi:hypothetical protein
MAVEYLPLTQMDSGGNRTRTSLDRLQEQAQHRRAKMPSGAFGAAWSQSRDWNRPCLTRPRRPPARGQHMRFRFHGPGWRRYGRPAKDLRRKGVSG